MQQVEAAKQHMVRPKIHHEPGFQIGLIVEKILLDPDLAVNEKPKKILWLVHHMSITNFEFWIDVLKILENPYKRFCDRKLQEKIIG